MTADDHIPQGGSSPLQRLDRAFVLTNQFVVAALLAAMTGLVFTNVAMRYLMGHSLTWVEELTRYMMIWLAYLGAGLAWRAGAHVAVDLLHGAIPAASARALRLAIAVGMIAFLAAVGWYGVAYSSFAMSQKSAVLSLPLGLVYWAIPTGCLLMILHVILGLRSYVDGLAPASDGRAEEVTA